MTVALNADADDAARLGMFDGLAETVETTKLMMVAAAVLSQAAETDSERDALRLRVAEIESIQDIGELNARRATFAEDREAAAANLARIEEDQAYYDSLSADQQQLMLNAAFNFSLAMVRNAQLISQGDDLIGAVRSNPMMLTRIGSLRSAALLAVDQGRAVRSMGGPLRALLSRGGVQAPEEGSVSEPMPVTL